MNAIRKDVTVKKDSKVQHVGKILFGLFALVVIASIGLGAPEAAAASSKIYDQAQKRWVAYTPQKAREFFKRHKQTPDAFRRKVVKFRTAEKPGTIARDLL